MGVREICDFAMTTPARLALEACKPLAARGARPTTGGRARFHDARRPSRRSTRPIVSGAAASGRMGDTIADGRLFQGQRLHAPRGRASLEATRSARLTVHYARN